MTNQMVGANVEELRQFGQVCSKHADEVQAIARLLRQQRPGVWLGPDSVQFFDRLNQHILPTLVKIATDLDQAAKDVERHASEQEQASSNAGGGAGSPGTGTGGAASRNTSSGGGTSDSGTSASGSADPASQEWLKDAIGYTGNISDLSELMGKGWPYSVAGPLAYLSYQKAMLDLSRGEKTGDTGLVWSANVDRSLASAGMLGPLLGSTAPLVASVGVGKAYVDATIPYTTESQDSLLDFQAERMFKKPRSELTPSQHDQLAKRYSGAWGAACMISDQMDHTADKVGKFFESTGKVFGIGR